MDSQTIINILTPVVAPAVVLFIKKVWVKVPTALLPVLCTAIGAGGNLITNWLAGNTANPTVAIMLGMAAIGAREIVDQAKKATNGTPVG